MSNIHQINEQSIWGFLPCHNIHTLFSNIAQPLLATYCNRLYVSLLSGYLNDFAARIIQVQSWRTLSQLMLNWHLLYAIAAWICKIQQEGPWRHLSQPTKSVHPYAVLSGLKLWEGMVQIGLGMQSQFPECRIFVYEPLLCPLNLVYTQ